MLLLNHAGLLFPWGRIKASTPHFPQKALGSGRRGTPLCRGTVGRGPAGGYLVEPVIVRLDAHTVQDLLDVLGAGGGIAPEGGQQIGGNVAHPGRWREPWRYREASRPHPGPNAAARGPAWGPPPTPPRALPAP